MASIIVAGEVIIFITPLYRQKKRWSKRRRVGVASADHFIATGHVFFEFCLELDFLDEIAANAAAVVVAWPFDRINGPLLVCNTTCATCWAINATFKVVAIWIKMWHK